jgi:hypothetical protein
LTERTSKDTGVSASPTGAHIWADGFDRSIKNIFDLQNQVTASVVGAIALKMERSEIERARRKPTEVHDGEDRKTTIDTLRAFSAMRIYSRH